MANNNNLVKLAQQLVTKGPFRVESSPRRVRAVFNGRYVIDTTNAHYVWATEWYPQIFVPTSAFTQHAKFTKGAAIEDTDSSAYFGNLAVGDANTDRVVAFNTPALTDLVKVDFEALDAWFDEDNVIHGGPKDPYKRIEIVPSSSHIRVAIDGVTLAESNSFLWLLEKPYRPRYYLPPTSMSWEYLKKSDTKTFCPYKGTASYHSVSVNGKEHKDLVWYYDFPIIESAAATGYLAFYNEKLDIWIDGVKEER